MSAAAHTRQSAEDVKESFKKMIVLSVGTLSHSEVIVARCFLSSLSYPVEAVGIAREPSAQ